MIVYTHRELYAQKPGWKMSPEEDCPGAFHVIDTSLLVWEAECDECGYTIGIPPRQQDAMIAQMRALAGEVAPPRRRR